METFQIRFSLVLYIFLRTLAEAKRPKMKKKKIEKLVLILIRYLYTIRIINQEEISIMTEQVNF